MWSRSILEWRIAEGIRLKGSINLQGLPEKKKESLVTAIYIGSVFIILAIVYYIHISDDLWTALINFFTSLTLSVVPSTGISLPAPVEPSRLYEPVHRGFPVYYSSRHLGNR